MSNNFCVRRPKLDKSAVTEPPRKKEKPGTFFYCLI